MPHEYTDTKTDDCNNELKLKLREMFTDAPEQPDMPLMDVINSIEKVCYKVRNLASKYAKK